MKLVRLLEGCFVMWHLCSHMTQNECMSYYFALHPKGIFFRHVFYFLIRLPKLIPEP